MRVLLVEDHNDTARVMSRLLEMNGHVVRAVGTVREALDKAAEQSFDWLVTDVHLPDGSGLDLLPRLRECARAGGRAVPAAVVVSGDDRDAEPAVRAGYVQHLIKPLQYERLLELIQGGHVA